MSGRYFDEWALSDKREPVSVVVSDELETVSFFRGQAGLRQRPTRAIREEQRRVAI